MTVTVRTATSVDLDALVRGNARMAEETEGRTLDPAVLREGVTRVLEDPAKGHYWVAEMDGRVVGQLMITREWSDWRNGVFWWIQSVFVEEDVRRAGVFRALYGHIYRLAVEDPDCCGLRLYVENYNRRAQRTYDRLGMANAGYVVMETEFGKNAGDSVDRGT